MNNIRYLTRYMQADGVIAEDLNNSRQFLSALSYSDLILPDYDKNNIVILNLVTKLKHLMYLLFYTLDSVKNIHLIINYPCLE